MTRQPTPEELDAGLALIATLEAQLNGNQADANAILEPWNDNLAPVLQFAVSLLARLVVECLDEPRIFIGALRTDFIKAIAESQP